jgi:predicted NUDIX family phosphoesterase
MVGSYDVDADRQALDAIGIHNEKENTGKVHVGCTVYIGWVK